MKLFYLFDLFRTEEFSRPHLSLKIVKLWLENIFPVYKNIFKPTNPNKTVKEIEKIKKEICSEFDLVLIFSCSDCGFMFKIYSFNFGFNPINLNQKLNPETLGNMSSSKWTTRLFSTFLPFFLI